MRERAPLLSLSNGGTELVNTRGTERTYATEGRSFSLTSKKNQPLPSLPSDDDDDGGGGRCCLLLRRGFFFFDQLGARPQARGPSERVPQGGQGERAARAPLLVQEPGTRVFFLRETVFWGREREREREKNKGFFYSHFSLLSLLPFDPPPPPPPPPGLRHRGPVPCRGSLLRGLRRRQAHPGLLHRVPDDQDPLLPEDGRGRRVVPHEPDPPRAHPEGHLPRARHLPRQADAGGDLGRRGGRLGVGGGGALDARRRRLVDRPQQRLRDLSQDVHLRRRLLRAYQGGSQRRRRLRLGQHRRDGRDDHERDRRRRHRRGRHRRRGLQGPGRFRDRRRLGRGGCGDFRLLAVREGVGMREKRREDADGERGGRRDETREERNNTNEIRTTPNFASDLKSFVL